MNVCVYCSSSDRVKPVYFEAAEQLGRLLGDRKNTLVYGGGNTGPMARLAMGVKDAGGRVISVIPQMFHDRGLTFERSDETVVTKDMQERRITMIKGSDVFLALPGGFGTLEEVAELLTMRQLELHKKPISLVDVDGYWNPFLSFLDQMVAGDFAKPEHRALLHLAGSPEKALEFVDR
ncbi:MAG: TIGR00730 family Rossman fold protein, partial [Gemmatimonadota bacterium]|nr:TIGR00730 family Rossman fold protein [Gemmatimonadota bacterium]